MYLPKLGFAQAKNPNKHYTYSPNVDLDFACACNEFGKNHVYCPPFLNPVLKGFHFCVLAFLQGLYTCFYSNLALLMQKIQIDIRSMCVLGPGVIRIYDIQNNFQNENIFKNKEAV